jgi:hypothetical protein
MALGALSVEMASRDMAAPVWKGVPMILADSG